MRKGLTEFVFILDRSGSMGGLEADTIGGFNGMIQKQKKESGEALISTILFDDQVEVLHDRVTMDCVPVMTEKEYFVRGCTALLDAIGNAIHHISNVHKYAREEDRPGKTLFVITTDGQENASKEYDYEIVKKMVEEKQKECGWEFIFIGANIDSVAEASRVGIKKERAINYVHDEMGTARVFSSVNKAVRAMRQAEKCCATEALDQCNWDEDVRMDYKKRRGLC